MVKKIKIAVHHESFHADDVLAVALIAQFIYGDIDITRVPHDTVNFDEYDYVLDVGMKHDGVKYFDHHQDKNSPSAAKLLWDSLNLKYPTIDKLVSLVSDFDTGVSKCSRFEYPRLIASFNSDDVHNNNRQYCQFWLAVKFTMSLLSSYVNYDDEKFKTEEIINGCEVVDGVIVLPHYCKGWQSFINGEVKPDVKRVAWFNDHNKKWYVQVPNMSEVSYALNGEPLKPSSLMSFVHANGFLATCATFEILSEYLKQN